MRLLVGVVTSLLVPLSVITAAPSTAANDSDAAALNSILAVSYDTAWGRDGGTWTESCTYSNPWWASNASYVRRKEFDATTATLRTRSRGIRVVPVRVPSTTVQRGRTRHQKVVGEVRRSMRVHGVRQPARWTRTAARSAVPRSIHPGAVPVWAPLADTTWTLTRTSLPSGGERFDARIEQPIPGSDDLLVHVTTYTADAQGRLIQVDARRGGTSGGVERFGERCVETWDWTRPRIAVPKRAASAAEARRAAWEKRGVVEVKRMLASVNRQIESGFSDAEAIAWLHEQVPRRHRLASGARLVWKAPKVGRHKPALAFRITVRDGLASYRPVR